MLLWREPPRLGRPRRIRLIERLNRVDREIATGPPGWMRRRARHGERRVLHWAGGLVERVAGRHPVGVEQRVQVVGGTIAARVLEHRARGGDQPLMVEERSTERRLEEAVGD